MPNPATLNQGRRPGRALDGRMGVKMELAVPVLVVGVDVEEPYVFAEVTEHQPCS